MSDGTLTVSGKGDLSQATITTDDKVFTDAAVNNVFTITDNSTYTSVGSGAKVNASTNYYTASRTYTQITDIASKATEKDVYEFTDKAYGALWVFSNKISDYSYKCYPVSQGDTPYKVQGHAISYDDQYTEPFFTTSSPDEANSGTGAITKSKMLEEGYVKSVKKQVLSGLSANTFKSKDGKTYTAVVDGDYYDSDYTYYTGSEATYTKVENIASMTDYVDNSVVSFADHLSAVLTANAPTTVIFKTADGETETAQINNEIVWALLGASSITKLDLEDTYLDKIDNRYPNNSAEKEDWTTVSADATLMPAHSTEHNKTLKTFYMPATKKGSKLGSNSFEYLDALENVSLSEGLDTLGYSCVNRNSLTFKLKTVILPNTVEVIEKWAFRSQDSIKNFVFPQTLKEIKGDAFAGTKPRDVYFLGLTAPKVAAWAWGDDAYLSNHSLTNSVEDQEDGAVVTVDVTQGVACRSNYYTAQNGWECMIHYPAVLLTTTEGKAQAARYTDLTRNYEKVVYATALKKTNDQGQQIAYYHVGEETEDIKGKSSITQSITCAKDFENMYQITVDPPYGGNYTGGYEDIYLGTQYIWPSMSMCDRATVVAQYSLLWNGVKTIGDGIRTYDSTFEGDGSEYAGMHQFVFAQADVTATDTKNWSLSNYADGLWHTICLPFDMTKKDMKDVFGQNAEGNYNHIRLCKFSKVERTETATADEEAHIKLCFNDEKFHKATSDDEVVLHAHTSYMIHADKEKAVEDEKTTNVMHNYAMVAGSPRPTNIKAVNGENETDYQYRFVGNYLPDMKMPQYSYFFTKSQMFKFQQGTTGKWTAYTCVIEAPDGTKDNELYFAAGGSQEAKLSTLLDFSEGEDQSTGVQKVTIEADGELIYTNENVYNLNGQLVSTNGLNGLAKGLYIVGGKKYIVK